MMMRSLASLPANQIHVGGTCLGVNGNIGYIRQVMRTWDDRRFHIKECKGSFDKERYETIIIIDWIDGGISAQPLWDLTQVGYLGV